MLRNLFLTVILLTLFELNSQTDSLPTQVSDIPGLVADTTSVLDIIDDEPDYEINTFKSSRLIQSQSVELIGKKNMDYRIAHRFGKVNTGIQELFGMDLAYQRMSFTFGLADYLNVEIGRSSREKIYDATVKWRLMRQVSKKLRKPVTVVFVHNTAVKTLKNGNPQYTPYYFTNRLYYTHQLLIARKFNEKFSLQLMPTIVHRNFVESTSEKNTVFSLGLGGRNLLSRAIAITYEYFHVFPNQLTSGNYDAMSIGVDIETGGHVFQLQFTNCVSMNEKGFITENKDDFLKGQLHFGFNLSRVFYIGR